MVDASHLHHAYGILRKENGQKGDVGETVAGLIEFFQKKLGVVTLGNPDFFYERFETLAIDDSRRIKEIASARRFSAESPRIFLIEIFAATREAQNALLKMLEEPEEGNHFFLVVPSFDMLLPTIRSRLSLTNPVMSRGEHVKKDYSAAEHFLVSSIKEKIAFVDALASDISDEKKVKHEAVDFLNSLEGALHSKIEKLSGVKKMEELTKNSALFESIARARSYMGDRAPSIKMLLEYVALR